MHKIDSVSVIYACGPHQVEGLQFWKPRKNVSCGGSLLQPSSIPRPRVSVLLFIIMQTLTNQVHLSATSISRIIRSPPLRDEKLFQFLLFLTLSVRPTLLCSVMRLSTGVIIILTLHKALCSPLTVVIAW